MKRRELLLATAGLGLFSTPPARAQPASRIYRIGYFVARGPDARLDNAFVQGLNELGYQEGRNVVIERRFGYNKAEAMPVLAGELASMKLDVILSAPNQAVSAMKQATRTIPIVMATGSDPVGTGLIASLSSPGGNVTGLSNIGTDIIGKEIQLLKETVPKFSQVAFLANINGPTKGIQFREAQAAVHSLHIKLHFEEVRNTADLDRAFAAIARVHAQGAVVALDPLMFGERQRLAELAIQHRMPTISAFREFADAGGLMAYGANLVDMFRRSATYVDKILKGANPADLPVEQPLKFDMVVNLKTAKALGLKVPQPILVRADEVIR